MSIKNFFFKKFIILASEVIQKVDRIELKIVLEAQLSALYNILKNQPISEMSLHRRCPTFSETYS
jgi:hypothetical protein